MKVISLLNPTVKCHGEAEQVLGAEVKGNGETKEFKELPKVTDNGVENMPKPQKGTHYLVNVYVFNALKDERDDLIMFDDDLTQRDEQGRAKSYGGVIFS